MDYSQINAAAERLQSRHDQILTRILLTSREKAVARKAM